MCVADDLFLGDGLRDLQSYDRGSQQADRFDYSLRCSPVQACAEDRPADARGDCDERERGTGK